jgi:hypothetical protein
MKPCSRSIRLLSLLVVTACAVGALYACASGQPSVTDPDSWMISPDGDPAVWRAAMIEACGSPPGSTSPN